MRKTIFLISILLATLSISSCGTNNEKSNQSVTEKHTISTSEDSKLSIDNFKEIPEEIEGCSCYFSENDMKFKNDEYLFVANFDSISYVSINKKIVKLKLVTTGKEPNTFGDNDHTDIYKSELYKVTVEIKYKDANGDETWRNLGKLTIENKTGKKITKQFVGECGC